MPALVSSNSPRGPRVKSIAFVAISIAALSAAGVWLWSKDPERDSIAYLPPEDRRSLYERTLRTLASTCPPEKRPLGLEGFCHEQAEFIVRFSECDARCKSLAAAQHPTPMK